MNGRDAAAGDAPPAEAGYFGDPARPCFGWLHRPWRGRDGVGVGLVIVPPFGYEAVCAHRSLRHLAEDAASTGLTVVRFDPDGSGDSVGDDLDPDRLARWLSSIDDACALARGAGADRIVLLGVRLGALLAALAAERRDDIAALATIAAVPSGKALLREGRALQMALGLNPAPKPAQDDVHDVVGFAMTAQTRTDIAAIDLRSSTKSPAPRVLIVERDDLPSSDAWADHLRALGADVDQRRLPGYVEMMLDPHRTRVPQAMIDAVIDYARRLPSTAAQDAARVLAPVPEARFSHAGVAIVERAAAPGGTLFGIVTERADGAAADAVLLVNAGAVGRIGPNRLYVQLARRLAARGHRVLRLDLSGIGDSRTRPGSIENTVYSAHALDDIAIAIEWLRVPGSAQVALVGLCSGAYHGLRAALANPAVARVVAINPLTFHYEPGMPLDFAAFRVASDSARYQRSIRSGASWRKLVRGDVDLGRVVKVMGLRARERLARPIRETRRRLGVPVQDDLGAELDTLARRGVALRFVFADDEPGRILLAEQGGSVVPRLLGSGALALALVEGADHTFTPRWTHDRMLDAVVEAIER